MKKIFILSTILYMAIVFTSCKKESDKDVTTETTVADTTATVADETPAFEPFKVMFPLPALAYGLNVPAINNSPPLVIRIRSVELVNILIGFAST